MKLLMIAMLIGPSAMAQSDKPKAVVYYLNASGQKISPADAIVSSVQGSEIFKCSQVEAKISKSGTSLGLKVKKK